MRASLLQLGLLALSVSGHRDSSTVDLGYAKYTGVYDQYSDIDVWKGIRYAAPPTGHLRFRAPVAPEHTEQTIVADQFGSACLQAAFSGSESPIYPPVFANRTEDCLFLNVWAPKNAHNLPVFVWIHGGGYNSGDGSQNLSAIIKDNGNNFIGVGINYRLGALGFLSSEDVKEDGMLNAGLLDQQLAFRWIQTHIHSFGGDRSKVTIHGASAGGGSVMLAAMAYGGKQGNALFQNAGAESPYLPKQYSYNDNYPVSRYELFAAFAGCGSDVDKLSCLRKADATTLDLANVATTNQSTYGSWAFSPVTDGTFIQSTPSTQLLENRALNGQNLWVGTDANEAPFFVKNNITTEEHLTSYLETQFPSFSASDINSLLETYPLSSYGANSSNPRFASAGDSGPTAVDVSSFAVGHQQRAYNIMAESTFHCVAYWLATAYSNENKSAYQWTYTSAPALHGYATNAYVGNPYTDNPLPEQGPLLVQAWRRMWGAYIHHGVPNIPASLANNPSSDVLSHWPKWNPENQRMVNFNQTGGSPSTQTPLGPGLNVDVIVEPGLQNAIREVDARTWEGGRGERCEFWRKMAPKVPM